VIPLGGTTRGPQAKSRLWRRGKTGIRALAYDRLLGASAELVFTLAALAREGESGLPNADSQRHADLRPWGFVFLLFATRKNLAAGFFIRWTIRTDFSSTMTRVLAE